MKIGIIGAGPAGTYCALRLLHLAQERALELDVHLFDPKLFNQSGRPGCNFCAGLITTRVVDQLRAHGVRLDGSVLQRPIKGFQLFAAGGAERFYAPAGHTLYSVFRGGGPHEPDSEPAESFDHHLLRQAVRAGARFVPAGVTAITRESRSGGPAWHLVTSAGETMGVDVLVGAFGVNSATASLFEDLGFGYRRPRCERAMQVEFRLDKAFIDRMYGDMVTIFDLGQRQVRLAALVPKRNHVSLTLIGDEPGWATVNWLLRLPGVRQFIPQVLSARKCACMCQPLLPIRPARNPIADRVMVIGDAHVARYFKNGIGSAFTSADYAARGIVAGAARRDIRRHYLVPCKKRFYRDNLIGRILFWLNDRIAKSPFHSAIQLECASRITRRGGRILNHALWGMFTGEVRYGRILLDLFHPACLAELALLYGRRVLSGTLRRAPQLGPLVDGARVAIIGGGVGGSCAALALLKEAARRDIRIKITLFEPKSFGTQYNQCLGVLTPPVLDVLRQELGVELEEGMILRTVTGYRLWSEDGHADLETDQGEEYGTRTVTIRRVELDRLLLDRAERSGVRIVQSRVTGIEIHPEDVILFADSGTYSAEAVIGAFGLDVSMQQIFAQRVGYQPPVAMHSIVIKAHPVDLEMIDNYQGRIESFLAPVAGTAFGAIVPKGNHLAIVIAGYHVTTRHLLQFLELPQVKKLLDFEHDLGAPFKGAFPNRPAKKFYGDRFVMIGDAAGLVRPFKGKGVNSAVITGIKVAETMIIEGISRAAFSKYARRCEGLAGHVRSGRIVQYLTLLLCRTLGIGPLIRFASSSRMFRTALYGAVSGTQDYRDVLLTSLKPRVLRGLVGAYLRFPSKSGRKTP